MKKKKIINFYINIYFQKAMYFKINVLRYKKLFRKYINLHLL